MMVGPEHGGVGTATRGAQLVPLYKPFMPITCGPSQFRTESGALHSFVPYISIL